MSLRPLRKCTVHSPRFYFDRYFEVAVDGVEMSWTMIAVVHGDDNAKKTAELGHMRILALRHRLLPNETR